MIAETDRDLKRFESVLGYRFGERKLLERALRHRSYANESPDPVADNQRLELLGDAVLGLVITEAVFQKHPDFAEGTLSKLKAHLVCEATLATIARTLELGDQLELGRGEETSGGRDKPSLLADAYEALIAAIYLDGGLEAARTVILAHHADALRRAETPRAIRDAKSRLQELVQQNAGNRPKYAIVEVSGPQHARVFTAEVTVDGEVVGRGEGRSKKEAQQTAAAVALEALGAT